MAQTFRFSYSGDARSLGHRLTLSIWYLFNPFLVGLLFLCVIKLKYSLSYSDTTPLLLITCCHHVGHATLQISSAVDFA